nr:aldo/keto reductase [uncultured Agathobaculum sp.]
MDDRVLGTDFTVSSIGLGCMGFSHAYGAPTEEQQAIRAIRSAYDMGYTLFDTAEVYGTQDDPHANERLVGKALKDVRDQVQIISKFGIRFDESSSEVNKPLIPDARCAVIRASVEGSLRRLGTDRIDLYFQHRIDPDVEPEVVAGVMADLIREGKILHWGISEANEDYLRRAHAVCPVTAVENRYSMMARQYEALFPALEELRVGFVAFSPMANGLLAGVYGKDSQFDPKLDYRSNMPQFTAQAAEQNRQLLQLLHNLAAQKSATPAQISLAWMLCKKPWIVPIPGTRKPERMRENAGAADVRLTVDEVAALDRALDTIPMSAVFGGTRVTKQFCNVLQLD